MEEIPIYYLKCPNGHFIETFVRETRICNQCHRSKWKKDYGRNRKRKFPLDGSRMELEIKLTS